MKSEKEIKKYLGSCVNLLLSKEKAYSSFDQITALDNIGREMENDIKKLRGQIDALQWVLNN